MKLSRQLNLRVSHRELTLLGEAGKIKSLALRNFYCEMVFLSVRLMKMSANGMRFCQMELLSPPIQLGKGVNQYINLISSWEDCFETGHFCFSLAKTEKIIIPKIRITNIILPSHSTWSACFCKDTTRMDVWAVEGWKGRITCNWSWTFSGVSRHVWTAFFMNSYKNVWESFACITIHKTALSLVIKYFIVWLLKIVVTWHERRFIGSHRPASVLVH